MFFNFHLFFLLAEAVSQTAVSINFKIKIATRRHMYAGGKGVVLLFQEGGGSKKRELGVAGFTFEK